MPELQGNALQAYQTLNGTSAYETSQESHDTNCIHAPRSLTDPPVRRPQHDAGSVFWVLADIMVHEEPEGGADYTSSQFRQFELQFALRFDNRDAVTPLLSANLS